MRGQRDGTLPVENANHCSGRRCFGGGRLVCPGAGWLRSCVVHHGWRRGSQLGRQLHPERQRGSARRRCAQRLGLHAFGRLLGRASLATDRTYVNPDSDPDGHPHTHADGYLHTYTHANRNVYVNPDGDSARHPYTYADQHRRTQPHADGHSGVDADADPGGHCHTDADGDFRVDPDANPDPYPHTYADGNVWADRDGDANSYDYP
jgi:hypothetical protein